MDLPLKDGTAGPGALRTAARASNGAPGRGRISHKPGGHTHTQRPASVHPEQNLKLMVLKR